ncbi:MAG: trehalose-6-phosphate synthase [Ideonella sp.]|nr:trehalose-6-phosphate synthase [Ideonella sp.]MCC7456192.1 trehalose-6-phosphate synthase [Nitrospira sp.]
MKTLQLQLRFLIPLLLALVVAALVVLPVMDQLTLRWFSRDLNTRGTAVASALSESIEEAMGSGSSARLQGLFERAARDERLVAIALCSPEGKLVRHSGAYPVKLSCTEARDASHRPDQRLELPTGAVHVGVYPVNPDKPGAGSLVLLHDMSFVDRRSQDTRQYLLIFIIGLGLVIALVTVIVAQLSWRGWVSGMRAILSGEGLVRPLLAPRELQPVAMEVRARLRDLEDEFRRSQDLVTVWNPERLRVLLHTQLRGDQVIVVSNREPYIHERHDGGVIVKRPASGLVTAVEPVMRACSGTWIAHGSGSADRDVVDAADRIGVPPASPEYRLRRIWLSEQEERGYYYGFANEGMWPLCHVAHVRPVFRESDWEQYRIVNQRFADAVVQEARGEDPVVLVQDYHFALLPQMIAAQLPRATILTFWHIPWPNPESFGICPWRREILHGMLGSTILGFHTRFHCKNFIETVDRYLEARIEHEHSSISVQGSETLIESYPISIEWPTQAERERWAPVGECRRRVFERHGLAAETCLAVGVDRFDYTKGILERLRAVENLLERYPQWRDRFVFVQVAAPTRSELEEYRSFHERIQRATDRINERFGHDGYRPIHVLAEHHEHDAVTELFRAADMCVVTSLHDGMNLVSKEFVAARDDEQGVLILSRFAGAARELTEALIVNPYHVEESADALHRAATMPVAEQRERMGALRMTVREYNVYRWAGRMLSDAGRWRLRQRIEARVQSYTQGDDWNGR